MTVNGQSLAVGSNTIEPDPVQAHAEPKMAAVHATSQGKACTGNGFPDSKMGVQWIPAPAVTHQ